MLKALHKVKPEAMAAGSGIRLREDRGAASARGKRRQRRSIDSISASHPPCDMEFSTISGRAYGAAGEGWPKSGEQIKASFIIIERAILEAKVWRSGREINSCVGYRSGVMITRMPASEQEMRIHDVIYSHKPLDITQ
jgi:hypothetical protein